MRVCISIAEHEIQMGHRWFDLVNELGGTEGHSLHLLPVSGLDISALIPKANQAFHGNVGVIKDEEEQTSDWQRTDPMRSASGPNSSFRQVAWHIYQNKLGPWFWCELDCIPLRKDWLNKLESEHQSCGKPFMGANVQIESVPEHMSGNAVYPWNVPEEAPTLVMRTNWTPKGQSQVFELAFDIAGAREVLPKAHFTNLIQHKFRFKGFESRAEFDAVIDKNAVVFHSDKKGTIYQYLRENLSGVVAKPDVKVESPDTSSTGLGFAPDEAISVPVPPAQPSYRDGAPWKSTIETSCPANPIQSDPHPPTAPVGWEAQPKPHGDPPTSTSGSPTVVSRTFSPELETVIAQNSVIKNGLPAMSPPWENREDSEKDVKMLCDALSLFCKAPIYKSRVRNALREAKIIK